MRLRKLIAAAGVSTAVAGLGLVNAGQASAFGADCAGNTHAVCLYYNDSAHGYGAYFMQTGDIPDYTGYTFQAGLNGAAGAGVAVKGHVAAVDNWYGGTFIFYFSNNYNCSVACQAIPPWSRVDLNTSLKNTNASGRFN
ncbi:hypothetical protein ACFYST_02455 [Kitasatospora sp. NPDC004614]|uniref:hypothetical protein n=1 Tax=unclassified Kitasatospora TaxID=2633591 RepID=UPI0036BF431E